MKHYHLSLLLFCVAFTTMQAQNVTITVNTAQGKRAVSPYIYGRNNTWKGWEHFEAKVLWSVIAYNIRVMTAHGVMLA